MISINPRGLQIIKMTFIAVFANIALHVPY